MSDIGSLRISVGLDSADFTRGMQDINARLRAVNSEFKASQAGAGRFDNSLTGLRSRADVLNRTMEVHRQKVQELRRRYEESAQATGENSEQTMRLAAQYNNAVAAMRNTEDQLNLVNRRIEEQTNQWLIMQRQLHAAGESLRKVGDTMKNIGKDLTMKVTTPIVGLGAAAVKTGIDFEKAMSEVGAISGATGNTFAEMEKKAMEMGSKTSKSATDSANALKYMSLAGWDAQTSMKALEPVLRLSEAGNLDLGRASDLVTDSMSALGLKVEQLPRYLDVLAQSSRKSNTEIDQMAEAYLKVGGTFNNLNVPLEEGAAVLGLLANRGQKGAEAGQALSSVIVNLTAPVGQAKKALDELKLSAFDAEGNFKGLDAVLFELKGKLNGMSEAQRNQYLSMIAGKEQIKTVNNLLQGLGDEYKGLKGDIDGANGALMEMVDTMTDNTQGNIDSFKSALEGLAITLSKHLLPYVTNILEKLTEWTRKFAALSPEAQKTILAVAGIAAAIGPLLVVGGTLISSIGAIMTGLGTLSGAIAVVTTGAAAATPAIGGLAAVFTALTGPIGITVAALAGIGVGVGILVKDLKKPSIEIERFGEEVSEATQKAVGGFLDLNDKATLALRELDLTSKEVTKETADAVTSNISQMADQMRDALEKRSTESLTIMQDFMKESVWISQQEKDEIIKNMNDKYTQQQEAITNGENIIKEIMQKAYDEKRELTTSEEIQINNIRENMVNNGIKILSQNEVEAKSIMERMKANASALTAEQAAEVVKKSIEQKEGAIQAAEEQYDQVVQNIIMQRDELGTITADQAHRMIFEAERQRDETVKHAEDMHQMVVDEAKAQAEEHVNHVNWETGEILTKWEKFKQDTSMKWQEMKTDAANWWKQTTTEVKSRAEEIKTNASNRFEELKKQTALKWGEIKEGAALWWKLTSEVVKLKAEEMRKNAVNKFTDLKTAASRKWIEIKDGIKKPFQEARDFIDEKINDIKGFFSNLKLEFPKIKMPKLPHFKLNGSFSLKPPSVPKLTVDWYAKGAIFTKPTIFNTPYGLKGFGEAGPEAALPLNDQVLGTIGAMIAKTMEKDNTSPSVNVVLNYQGNNVHDAYTMVDIIEEELNTRFTNRAIVNGVNP